MTRVFNLSKLVIQMTLYQIFSKIFIFRWWIWYLSLTISIYQTMSDRIKIDKSLFWLRRIITELYQAPYIPIELEWKKRPSICFFPHACYTNCLSVVSCNCYIKIMYFSCVHLHKTDWSIVKIYNTYPDAIVIIIIITEPPKLWIPFCLL